MKRFDFRYGRNRALPWLCVDLGLSLFRRLWTLLTRFVGLLTCRIAASWLFGPRALSGFPFVSKDGLFFLGVYDRLVLSVLSPLSWRTRRNSFPVWIEFRVFWRSGNLTLCVWTFPLFEFYV